MKKKIKENKNVIMFNIELSHKLLQGVRPQ